jgi:hypothetical protein
MGRGRRGFRLGGSVFTSRVGPGSTGGTRPVARAPLAATCWQARRYADREDRPDLEQNVLESEAFFLDRFLDDPTLLLKCVRSPGVTKGDCCRFESFCVTPLSGAEQETPGYVERPVPGSAGRLTYGDANRKQTPTHPAGPKVVEDSAMPQKVLYS